MRLLLLHPEVTSRSCAECKEFLYDDKPNAFATRPVDRGGKIQKRHGGPTPCSMCPKQPQDVPDRARTPATAIELSERNWKAYVHDRECSAVGEFPSDEIVRRNAAIIRQAEKHADKVQQARFALAMVPN